MNCVGQSHCDSLYNLGKSYFQHSEIDSFSFYWNKLVTGCPEYRKMKCARELLYYNGHYQKTKDDLVVDSLLAMVDKEFKDKTLRLPFYHAVDSLFPNYYRIGSIQGEIINIYFNLKKDTITAIQLSDSFIKEGISNSDCPGNHLYFLALNQSIILANFNENKHALETFNMIGNEIPLSTESSGRHLMRRNRHYMFIKGYLFAKSGEVDSTMKYLGYLLFLPEKFYRFEEIISYEGIHSMLIDLLLDDYSVEELQKWHSEISSNVQFSEERELVNLNPKIDRICVECKFDFPNRSITLFDYCYDYIVEDPAFIERGAYYSSKHCEQLILESYLLKRIADLMNEN